MLDSDEGLLTIEQVAQETGMTVRNIRAHQSRGLLPPPEVRARTGYYRRDHVARLRLIQEMQADGFNLNAIKRLLDGGRSAAGEELLSFARALRTPFESERPEVVEAEELAARFGGTIEPKLLSRAEKLGVICPLGEGRYEVPSPLLMRAGEELFRAGVPLDAALWLVERLNRHSEGVANAFVKVFLERIWKPFQAAGRPDERWPEVREAFERLRPLASEALIAVFHQTMTRAVEDAFGKELERGGLP